MEQTFTIPSDNLAGLKADLDRAVKRAKKLGVGFSYNVGDRQMVEKKRRDPFTGKDTTVVSYTYPVTLYGDNPMLGGWKVAGVVTDLPENGTLVRSLPNVTLPEGAGKVDAHWCDHCQQVRGRKTTYLLLNEDGTVKQVGTSCLKDFTGIDNPFRAADWAELLMVLLAEAGDFESDDWGGGGSHERWMVSEHFMATVVHFAHTVGFMSGKEAYKGWGTSTANRVWDLRFDKRAEREDDGTWPTEEEEAEGTRLLEWARERYPEATEEMSDYIYNLAKVVQTNYVCKDTKGLLASLYRHYEREMQLEVERRSVPAVLDEALGEVGKRSTYDFVLLGTTVTEGYYGPTIVVKLSDLEGRRAVWFASGGDGWKLTEMDKGSKLRLTATVKAQEQYNGHAETILSRCKVVEA